MECNFLEKSPEEFVELFYSDCFPQWGCQADYDDTFEAIVMKEHDKDKKYPHNTQIFFYRLDQENMLEEIVNLAGYEVTTL
jgi:hypothetical protein